MISTFPIFIFLSCCSHHHPIINFTNLFLLPSPDTTPTTLLVRNLTSTIKYHIIILSPLHNTVAKPSNNEHTQKKHLMKLYTYSLVYCYNMYAKISLKLCHVLIK
ncbi:hypothetical protein PHAVU_009G100800 [Phaseolus vulgaris]|uniref:Uncharacterized protein n=1 Tax=Phaseolus vulgaris TaxID=3885 RepID=V7AU41_PHAVU|nr:hypothetical protein PHAVU_009G100800g [Phaseolus vulgaris]ESW09109.1 hypothetical protein PHAVU_009G100800g [Phaseolus vulgaris]